MSRLISLFFSGDDFTALPTVTIGGRGVISVVSNLEPAKTAAMIEAAMSGDAARAKALHYELFSLMGAMFCYPSPAPAKKGLELMGKIASGEVRLPMTQMDESSLARLRRDMAACGLL